MQKPEKLSKILLIAGVLYFAEGFPFGIVDQLLPLFTRSKGASLEAVGFLSTIGIAWTIKFFWAPAVDRIGSYLRWTRAMLALLALSTLILAIAGYDQRALFWFAVTLMAFASATQDIAIDGYALTLADATNVGPLNSARMAAYRLAMIAAGGGLPVLLLFFGWNMLFVSAAVIFALLLFTTFTLPDETRNIVAARKQFPLREWLARSSAPTVLAIALLYRLGDATLNPMIKPFWLDSGYRPVEIGTATTTLGIGLTIVGGVAAGFLIPRLGLWRSLLILGIFQMLSNIGYAVAAAGDAQRELMYGASVLENLAGGMGIASLMSFLMTACDREEGATEFALLTALFGLTRTLAGTFSGFAADALGYETFFWLTTVLALPALFVVMSQRKTIDELERSRNA